MAVKEFKLLLANKLSKSNSLLKVRNPFNNSLVAETFFADEKILNNAVDAAVKAFPACKNLPSYKKYNVLLNIANRILDNKKDFTEIICLESGKPYKYAMAEVERSAQTFTIAAEESKRLPKEYMALDWTPNGENKEGIVKFFPAGVVAGIAPFNFPLNLAVHKIAPAIAAGCPIVLKPATRTPLSTLLLAQIIAECELPEGSVSILPMSRETGNLLVTDERIQILSFTGSPEAGWEMKKQAGRKKTILELGGNAGVIVSPSCNLEDAVQKSLIGAFAYSGQICIHAQRFFIHDKCFNTFLSSFIKGMSQLKYGDPLHPDTDVSVMIDEANAKRVDDWIKQALQKGAVLLAGGKRKDNYVEPTILTNTNNSMKVCSEEIFGPVVTIEKYSEFSEAVEHLNNTRFGLQAGVFTDSVAEMNYAFENIACGGVILNNVPTQRFDHMPYGGIKDSGAGREGVKYAILDMLEPKILVK